MVTTRSVSQKEIDEKWYLIDASGERIGRIASKAAELLMGKSNPLVKDYIDPKVKVVVINSSKIDFTSKRGFSKFYKHYSGYPGGLSFQDLETKFKKNPNFIIENAVKGMLPKTKKGRSMFLNLKVFADEKHVHEAQKPEAVKLSEIKL